MILTTTYTENYGREEIHKTLVQMADVAVTANESDVLWRHATFVRDRLKREQTTHLGTDLLEIEEEEEEA